VAKRESALEAWAVAWARFRGMVVAKLTGLDGVPDRIFFAPGGRPVIVEFKRVGKHGKRLQAETQPWYLATLTAAGYRVFVVDTKEQFLEVMECRNEGKITRQAKTSSRSTTARSAEYARRALSKTLRSRT
jgi:hypothetical protein